MVRLATQQKSSSKPNPHIVRTLVRWALSSETIRGEFRTLTGHTEANARDTTRHLFRQFSLHWLTVSEFAEPEEDDTKLVLKAPFSSPSTSPRSGSR